MFIIYPARHPIHTVVFDVKGKIIATFHLVNGIYFILCKAQTFLEILLPL